MNDSQSVRYYIRIKGVVTGPHSVERLRSLVARGRVNRHVEVSDDRQHWRLLASVPGLFVTERSPGGDGSKSANPGRCGPHTIGRGGDETTSRTAGYYSMFDGRMNGPEPLELIMTRIGNGQYPPGTRICAVGTNDWIPLEIVASVETPGTEIVDLGLEGDGETVEVQPAHWGRVASLIAICVVVSIVVVVVSLLVGFPGLLG